ncbi:MAG: radical SAM protein [Sandaracinaceae bacterium]|nr:radical SAM protein [Sandaracinaceae bacterium]
MSSLGYQTIYRSIHASGRGAERAFLPDDVDAWKQTRAPLFTYEGQRPVSSFRIVAVSVAYETEIAGLIQALELAGIPPLAADRGPRDPFILCGGPLTFSNPLPLAPFADAVLMGEADETVHQALDIIFASNSHEETLATLGREIPSCFVPTLHGDEMPPIAQCDDAKLPAYGQITTPNTELRDMFLLETSRGCSRGCRYCVMRRSTNGGMRIVPMETIFERIPDDARRVGLVGAAVSDHPKIADIVEKLVDQGREVGLSSLRPDRLNDRFVAALKRGGYKTLTTAGDGPSERVRESLQRKTREKHLVKAAELARLHGMERMKLYMMVGVPGEEDEDIDELVRFSSELSKIIPLSMGVAPFVAKRNTPLDGEPFAGMPIVEHRMDRLRRGVRGRVDVRATSARWAWIEYVLAQGGRAEGLAVLDAVHAGGKFSAWKRAFDALPATRTRRALRIVA